ncbi:hypothetical protein FRB94_010407 [Tulasnella sp. JGI-2019a]|nr:hypothetical protein FRB94_010407 [Tulasnella sp. JGI-2019a]KAG9039922.1 hypothetical protein FRB95_004394 [Tulasnella sp. JGI-2019a]
MQTASPTNGNLEQSVNSLERGSVHPSAHFDNTTGNNNPSGQDEGLRQRGTTDTVARTGTMGTARSLGGTTIAPTPISTATRQETVRSNATSTNTLDRLRRGKADPRRDTGVPPGPKRTWREKVAHLMEPTKKVGETPTVGASIKAIVFASWLNVLLVFIPVSWALHFAKVSDTVIFVTAFLAIIPLAKLLGFATEELALRVGETLGGLLNATLGNAVELIVSILALIKCELRVVQASLIGSILSNLLLVLGMCFFAGGIKYSSQGFMIGAAQLNSSLLTLSVIGILIPATFHAALSSGTSSEGTIDSADQGERILKMSHGVAIILLFIYGCNLVYQLWTHSHLYDNKNKFAEVAQPSLRYPHNPNSKFYRFHAHRPEKSSPPTSEGDHAGQPTIVREGEQPASPDSPHGRNHLGVPAPNQNDPEESLEVIHRLDDEEEQPQISVWACAILLVSVTVLVAITAEFLVSSINGLVDNTPLSEEWVGLILLPIVGNAAEHVTAVTVSVKDKLDLSIGVAVGSSIQIALFVIPFIVTLGWMIGKPLTLLFDPFEAVVLFLTVITVNYVVADGQSNWLEGMILMCLYVVIAVSLWFYPGSDPAAALLTCT